MAAVDTTVVARAEESDAEPAQTRDVRGPVRRSVGPGDSHPDPASTDQLPVSDRRGVVKLLAAGAVGAVASAALHAQPAAAADNDPVLQGKANHATGVTSLTATDNTALYLWSDVYQGLQTDGAYGNALFTAGGDSPLGQAAWAGTLWVDKDGNWWAATHTDTQNAEWRKLAGPQSAGALHLLDSPKRVYDSRPGEQPDVGPKTPLTPNVARTIDPKLNSSGVPAGARGVLITLTIPVPSANGYATVWPSGAWPGTSNINFAQNQVIATTTVVGLATGATFQVLSSVTTNVVIDVVGYYV